MKSFPICYDVNYISKLLINHKAFDMWLLEDGTPYQSSRWPGVAILSGDFCDYSFDIESKEIIVWNALIAEDENRHFFRLPMRDKQLMNEFFTHFRKKLNMSRTQFDLLLNL